MHARTGRVSFSPDKADDVIGRVRDIVAQYREQDGFERFTLLVDRANGEAIGISFWKSEDAMRAAEAIGQQARRGAAESGSGQDEGAGRYEVAIDTTE